MYFLVELIEFDDGLEVKGGARRQSHDNSALFLRCPLTPTLRWGECGRSRERGPGLGNAEFGAWWMPVWRTGMDIHSWSSEEWPGLEIRI